MASLHTYTQVIEQLEYMVQLLLKSLKETKERNKCLLQSHLILSELTESQSKTITSLQNQLKEGLVANCSFDENKRRRREKVINTDQNIDPWFRNDEQADAMIKRLRDYQTNIDSLTNEDILYQEVPRKTEPVEDVDTFEVEQDTGDNLRDPLVNISICCEQNTCNNPSDENNLGHKGMDDMEEEESSLENTNDEINTDQVAQHSILLQSKVEEVEEQKDGENEGPGYLCKTEIQDDDDVQGGDDDVQGDVDEVLGEEDVQDTVICHPQTVPISADDDSRIVTSYENLECDICGKRLKNVDFLMLHKVSMHPAPDSRKDHPYFCPFCGEGFKTKKQVQNHVLQFHDSSKSISCPHCPRKFKSISSHYNAHLRTHGVEPVKLSSACEVCGKQFSTARYLKIHTDICYGIKKHACPYCQKRFSRDKLLQDHLRIHTGEFPYTCVLCGKKFRSYSVVLNHARKTHQIKSAKELKIQMNIEDSKNIENVENV